ncbi:unnamed protein product, partial [Didymodactylos carnosus]
MTADGISVAKGLIINEVTSMALSTPSSFCNEHKAPISTSKFGSYLKKCGMLLTPTRKVTPPSLLRSTTIKQEISLYSIISKMNYDLSLFGLEYGRELPLLSTLIKKYLAIPATSVASEKGCKLYVREWSAFDCTSKCATKHCPCRKIECRMLNKMPFETWTIHRLYQFKKHQRPYRIILIRHGESLANVDKTIYTRIPDSQIDLTDAGIEQARQAGKQLREIIRNETLYVYLSPYKRSKQTYDAIA